MASKEELLITPDEAEEVVQVNSGVAAVTRTPMLVVVGILMIVVFTGIVMIVLSLRGVKTGLGGSSSGNSSLQLPSE